MKNGFRSKNGRALAAAVLGAVLFASGCGSTRSDKELGAQANQTQQPETAPSEPGPVDAGVAPSPSVPEGSPGAPGAADLSNAAGSGGSTAESRPAGAPSAAPGRSQAAGMAGGTAPASGGAGGGSASPAVNPGAKEKTGAKPGPAPGPAPVAPGAPAASAGSGGKSEIVLGSIGTDSGLMGELMLPVVQGARAWAADVNARGGLNGHPVRVLFGDDGGDPAKALAVARKMVEQDGVQAFYMTHGPTTAQAVAPFLEQRRIPVIGSCSCELPSSTSPMWFTVGPSSISGLAWSQVLPLLAFSEERTVSIMYCREAPGCRAARDVVHKTVAKSGLKIVHDAEVSLASPDYTAEVLAARNAGAKAIIAFIDNFSVVRLARSAHRQGWKPPISAQYSVHDERIFKQGAADIEGLLVGGSMLHWESPKLGDYRTALSRYVPGGIKSSYTVQSYATGKLMELIAKGFGDKVGSEDFLKGLYGLRNETLGGLIPSLTFEQGTHDNTDNCIIPLKISGGKFIPKDGDNYACAPR